MFYNMQHVRFYILHSFYYFQKTFAKLTHIVKLDLSRNQLTELPENFGDMRQLKYLDLYSNQVSFSNNCWIQKVINDMHIAMVIYIRFLSISDKSASLESSRAEELEVVRFERKPSFTRCG